MDVIMDTDSQRKRIHPHKFTLWIAMASIIMMFAGLTSAYIVKSEQPKWTTFEMPGIFWYSTAVLLLSSLTVHLAQKAFRERSMGGYRRLITVTALLGLLFVVLQCIGFYQLWNSGITLEGSGAAQFMYVIFSLHGLHVLGGVVVLLVIFFRAFSAHVRNYNPLPIEIAGTYWHFVDVLWIYLFIFFMFMQ
jgi:cytochrome c oxidase subunit 3